MLHLRALGRAGVTLGLTRVASSSPSACASLTEQAGASKGGWRRLLDEYGDAAYRLTAGAPVHSRREEAKDGRSLTGATLLAAERQGGSTFNDPDVTAREAGGSRTADAGAGSSGYLMLAAAHAGLAAACFAAPTAIGNLFFPGAALPQGFQSQALVKLLGCGAAFGSSASFGLKQLADGGQVASPTAQRLQLGLMGLSSGAVAMHALYSPSLSGTALMAGAALMGVTFAVPYQHYVKTNGGLRPGEAVKSYFTAIPDHFNISGLHSGLYSLVTPVLALAGASYLFAPGMSLTNVFGFVKGVDAFFWWQLIGGCLMTVAPAVTYSLKKLADDGHLNEPVAKSLSAGLVAAALGHLAVMGPMVAANQGGPALPWVVGAWATALLTGGLGLMGGGAAKAAA